MASYLAHLTSPRSSGLVWRNCLRVGRVTSTPSSPHRSLATPLDTGRRRKLNRGPDTKELRTSRPTSRQETGLLPHLSLAAGRWPRVTSTWYLRYQVLLHYSTQIVFKYNPMYCPAPAALLLTPDHHGQHQEGVGQFPHVDTETPGGRWQVVTGGRRQVASPTCRRAGGP